MRSFRVVKVAVIGCGSIAESAHLPAYLSTPLVKVVAVADANEDRLRYVSRKFAVRNLYVDYCDLLEKESDLDGVSICLPTYLHKDAVIACARQKKHILCEKPLALSVDDAREMVEIARKHGVLLYVGFCLRFAKVFTMLRKRIADGFLAEPFSIKARVELLKKPEKGSWYFDRGKGGGCLFDMGSHAADLLQWIFGGARVVSAQFTTFRDIPDVDAEATVNLAFSNRAEGILKVSWNSSPEHYYIEADGPDGRLSANLNESTLLLQKERRILGRSTNGFHLIVDQRLPYHWEQIREFIDVVGDRAIGTGLATGGDGLSSLELITSAYSHWHE
jgi:UDP-N-acetylglucosamine 3-dehydrogenase